MAGRDGEPMSSRATLGGSLDTIFALASGVGRSAVSIVRISGSDTRSALQLLLPAGLPEPRRASLRRLFGPKTNDILDQALILWLPGPGTFTGEDQAELQIHGSPAVRAAVLRVLSSLPGLRAAEPGEFTRRALLNGRLDLTAVEGLADLIEAETEAQRRQALRQLEGSLAKRVQAWRARLLDALASCEAALDFSDEDDVPDDVAASAADVAGEVGGEIAAALAGASRGERVRDGFQVVIAGAPNAGKSTLLNAIARRDVAIVSPIAGTTRDAIEVRCDLGGLPVVLVDTAGLRDSDDLIEREGVARARARMDQADLVLWLSAGDAPDPGGGGVESFAPCRILKVATKVDLDLPMVAADIAVSAKTGDGIDRLLNLIKDAAAQSMDGGADAVLTRERHRAVLNEVHVCLDRAADAGQGGVELLAEDLRLALRHLGRMTGAVDVEEVLDRIFSSFCIGK